MRPLGASCNCQISSYSKWPLPVISCLAVFELLQAFSQLHGKQVFSMSLQTTVFLSRCLQLGKKLVQSILVLCLIIILFHTLTIISSLENRSFVLVQLLKQISIISADFVIQLVFSEIGFLGFLSIMLIREFREKISISTFYENFCLNVFIFNCSISHGKLEAKLRFHGTCTALPFRITDFKKYFEFMFFI